MEKEFRYVKLLNKLKRLDFALKTNKLFAEKAKKRIPVLKSKILLIKLELIPYHN